MATELSSETRKYEVGGIRLSRPFRIQRLGHLGFNLSRMDEGFHFYRDLLGYTVSDPRDMTVHLDAGARETIEPADRVGYFMRYGSDHHSLVLAPTAIERARGRMQPGSEITVGQISWQVGSLRETVDCVDWLRTEGCEIYKSGRDMPGSNWHTYMKDPDGHVNELFYGMEQIGWEGRAKPHSMHDRGFAHSPELPQPGETAEVDEALTRGDRLADGYRPDERLRASYDVGGVLLARPFKVVGQGPIRLFVDDLEAALRFYQRTLGFVVTETVNWRGYEAFVLRCSAAHHCLGLYPKELRSELGLSPHTTAMSFGMRVATYAQLRDAAAFLTAAGVELVDLPPELTPGIEYAVYARDPDGHVVELYCAMEQIGWDGLPRPTSLRRVRPAMLEEWPAALDEDEPPGQDLFFGPLG